MKSGPPKNLVTIKGTKDGLTIMMDDRCSFDALKTELQEKIEKDKQVFGHGPEVEVTVDTGYRYVGTNEQEEIINLLKEAESIRIKEFRSEVVSREEAERLREEESLTSITRIVRSGQVISVRGDVLLLGDVNPGGAVEATGNVYILGTLKGTARAGLEGNTQAVVCASVMEPTQISVSDVLFYAPDRYERKQQQRPMFDEPVFAYIEAPDNQISFEKTRLLTQFQNKV
ncbi:septum site-determining protein MinC [Salibacterium lacus]|uniref:Probable septum site-determining protein MinC n=1 Tax=Salibacterium lacus TaxID=1898109 RepID=A0ABW5T0A4_9BACI